MGKWIPVCYKLHMCHLGHCNVYDKFEFNCIISLCSKYDFERYGLTDFITVCIFYDDIVMYFAINKTTGWINFCFNFFISFK